jgi:hypothetical protein
MPLVSVFLPLVGANRCGMALMALLALAVLIGLEVPVNFTDFVVRDWAKGLALTPNGVSTQGLDGLPPLGPFSCRHTQPLTRRGDLVAGVAHSPVHVGVRLLDRRLAFTSLSRTRMSSSTETATVTRLGPTHRGSGPRRAGPASLPWL